MRMPPDINSARGPGFFAYEANPACQLRHRRDRRAMETPGAGRRATSARAAALLRQTSGFRPIAPLRVIGLRSRRTLTPMPQSSAREWTIRAEKIETLSPRVNETTAHRRPAGQPKPGAAEPGEAQLDRSSSRRGLSMPKASAKSVRCSCSCAMISRSTSLKANSPIASACRIRWR